MPLSKLLHTFNRYSIPNYLIVVIGAILMFFPFWWMIATSFKPRSEILLFPPTLWPNVFTLENYVNVFRRLDVALVYWNTFYVTMIKTFVMVYTAALLGYVFCKFYFPARDIFFYFILFTMILPFEVFMLPLYQMMVDWGLANTHSALIVPNIFSAYAIFLFRQFIHTIPNDYIHAARIDGAGEWSIFHRIVLPLSGPVLATTTSFYFMWNWNDFLWPLIVITESKKAVLPLALAGFVLEHGSDYGLIMAGAALAIIPILTVFILLQRYVVQGIALTGVK